MLGFLDNLYDLLDGSGTMGMSTEIHWVLLHILNDLSQLIVIAALSNLLCQIVTERIIHDFDESIDSVIKDQRVRFWVIFLNFLLKEPTATLILSQ